MVKDRFKRELRKRAQQVVMKLMTDERTQPLVVQAMQALMEGRQRLDRVRAQTAHSLGLAAREDVQALRGRLRRLAKQLDAIEKQLSELQTQLAAG